VVKDGTRYKQVTIRINYKGVVLRGSQDGSTIGTKNQYSVSGGQFILSRIDARSGAFGIVPDELEGAIVTNDFLAFDINETKVEREFFNVFLQSPVFLEACIKASRGNTNRKRVQEDFLLNYEINLPSLSEQHRLIKRITRGRASITEAQRELDRQQSLLNDLRRAILQDAIQGRLTSGWRGAHPGVEPASQLLERLRAEKARLVAVKQRRAEKPPPAITSGEIPLEIPKGWECVRLIDLCEKTGSGSTPSGGKSTYSANGVPFLRSQNVHDDGVVLDNVARISNAIHQRMAGTTVFPDDLLLNITGGSIGRCALVSAELGEANVNQHVAIIRPVLRSVGKYLHSVILSPYFQDQIEETQTGAGREGLPKNKMDRIAIPLPSLAEQSVIVERVAALMQSCRALEAGIDQSRTHAAQLLQAVLREAFAPQQESVPPTGETTVKKPLTHSPSKSDPQKKGRPLTGTPSVADPARPAKRLVDKPKPAKLVDPPSKKKPLLG
jgi:type I restriction enzyme S subunit